MSDGPSDEYPEGRPGDDDDSDNDEFDPPPYDDGYGDDAEESALQGRFQVSHHTARMPEFIGSGVFANALMVLAGPMEVILDFVQRLSEPNRVVARVVLPPIVAKQFAATLRQNMDRYEEVFGGLPELPKPRPVSDDPDEKSPSPIDGTSPGGIAGDSGSGLGASGAGGGIVGAGLSRMRVAWIRVHF